MTLIYHRLAIRDVRGILDYYESEVGTTLADRFFEDLGAAIESARLNPRAHPPFGATLRRANLSDFPYHVLYEEKTGGIRVMVVRHHKRHPSYGSRRH